MNSIAIMIAELISKLKKPEIKKISSLLAILVGRSTGLIVRLIEVALLCLRACRIGAL